MLKILTKTVISVLLKTVLRKLIIFVMDAIVGNVRKVWKGLLKNLILKTVLSALLKLVSRILTEIATLTARLLAKLIIKLIIMIIDLYKQTRDNRCYAKNTKRTNIFSYCITHCINFLDSCCTGLLDADSSELSKRL